MHTDPQVIIPVGLWFMLFTDYEESRMTKLTTVRNEIIAFIESELTKLCLDTITHLSEEKTLPVDSQVHYNALISGLLVVEVTIPEEVASAEWIRASCHGPSVLETAPQGLKNHPDIGPRIIFFKLINRTACIVLKVDDLLDPDKTSAEQLWKWRIDSKLSEYATFLDTGRPILVDLSMFAEKYPRQVPLLFKQTEAPAGVSINLIQNIAGTYLNITRVPTDD